MAPLPPAWLALPWAVPLLALVRLARREPDLARAPVAGDERVSVIVPARNESVTIDTLLPSLLASTYPDFEVLVVDDRSTDDTAVRVAAWAARDARVRLLRGEELPAGWLGKPWACTQGAAAATGSVLVFTDADTTHAPALLGRAVGALRAGNVDLLTVTTHLECVTFWERVVMPQIFALLGIRYTPARVNAAHRPWDVVANGQFLVLPRASYDALGGHALVRAEVAEDLALAQHCVRRGMRLRLFAAESLISTRMYRSLGELVEGWSKNLHLGARLSMPPGPLRALAPFGVAAAFVFWLVPFAMPFAGTGAGAPALAVALSLLFWAVMLHGMRIPLRYALLYPLGALTSLVIVARSIGRGRRRVAWRGREYRLDNHA